MITPTPIDDALGLGVKAQLSLIEAIAALQSQANRRGAIEWLDEAQAQIALMRQSLAEQEAA
jgi:hypothetical protein